MDRRTYREGISLIDRGLVEEGIAQIEQACEKVPDDLQCRIDLLNLKTIAANRLLLAADGELSENRFPEAEKLYSRALKLDKENPRAKSGLDAVAQARRHSDLIASARSSYEAGNMDSASREIQPILLENPNHQEAKELARKIETKRTAASPPMPVLAALHSSGKNITLEFRDASLKSVFDALFHETGINFIFDKELRSDQRVSILVKQVTLERALSLLLETNQLGKKIIDNNTVLIYQKNPQKSNEYEELLVRSFYLANASPKQIAGMLRSILKVKDVSIDERLNLVVVRDTLETMQLVEKLIAAQDLPDPEVLLEVTVIEVTRNRLLDLGIQPPLQFGVLNPNPNQPITLDALRRLNGASTTLTPSPSVNLKAQNSNADILANPRIRVRNHEKAKIHIGDRVPIITTASNQTNTGFISENVQYVDVGIKLEVEPNIYLGGDVAIKLNLEVSSLGTKTTTKNGSEVYQVGTRSASTLLRLKDGETQLLAGLMSDEDRRSTNGLPGLSEVPLFGRLFSGNQDNKIKTEIVLSITPHLVRKTMPPGASVTNFWSGTKNSHPASYSGSFTNAQPDQPAIPENGMEIEQPVDALPDPAMAQPPLAPPDPTLAPPTVN